MVITHTQDLHKHLTSNLPSPNGTHFYYWDDVIIPKTLPGKQLYKNEAQTKFGWGKTSLIVVTLKNAEMSAMYDRTKSEKPILSTEPGCFIWPFQTGTVNLRLVTNYPLFSSQQITLQGSGRATMKCVCAFIRACVDINFSFFLSMWSASFHSAGTCMWEQRASQFGQQTTRSLSKGPKLNSGLTHFIVWQHSNKGEPQYDDTEVSFRKGKLEHFWSLLLCHIDSLNLSLINIFKNVQPKRQH